jgi:hypothetical protein
VPGVNAASFTLRPNESNPTVPSGTIARPLFGGRSFKLGRGVTLRDCLLVGCSDPISRERAAWAIQKDLQMRAFQRAAEGIRTLDLLHGKQNLRRQFGSSTPAKRLFLLASSRVTLPGSYREITGVWVVNG